MIYLLKSGKLDFVASKEKLKSLVDFGITALPNYSYCNNVNGRHCRVGGKLIQISKIISRKPVTGTLTSRHFRITPGSERGHAFSINTHTDSNAHLTSLMSMDDGCLSHHKTHLLVCNKDTVIFN